LYSWSEFKEDAKEVLSSFWKGNNEARSDIAESAKEAVTTKQGFQNALDRAGYVFDGADIANALIYGANGEFDKAAIYALAALPLIGDIKGALKGPSRVTTDMLSDVTVVSKGKIVGQGTVDLREVVSDITSGTATPRDVFKNREGLLPTKPEGYYKEYTVPTPGVSGAGSQRIVRGNGGELYYTPNHYETFIPLN